MRWWHKDDGAQSAEENRFGFLAATVSLLPDMVGEQRCLWTVCLHDMREDPMTEKSPEKDARKEAMKELRKTRKQAIAAATARMKEQKKALKAVKEALSAAGATVPEVVEHTGMPSEKVFWYLATMKKYGEIVEGKKEGGYFRYELTAKDASQEEAAQEA